MTDAQQQPAPEQKTPFGNKIAACIMIGLGLIVGVVEWTHGTSGHEQQAGTGHHLLHSAATTGSGG